MKVLIINGSPRRDGNTCVAIREMEKVFAENGMETKIVTVGNRDIRGCIACGSCYKNGKCVFDDAVNETAADFAEADALIVATPVYYASANATLVAFLQRLFYSTHFSKSMKVGAAVAVARRSGTTATFDELNKFFTISGMPVASSCYWNNVYGRERGEAEKDEEGLQTVRQLARNVSFLVKSIALGKKEYGMPETEQRTFTNFIR